MIAKHIQTLLLTTMILSLGARHAHADPDQSTEQQNSERQNSNSVLKLPDKVVTADRLETKLDTIGRSIEVRTREEFEQLETQTLTGAVQDVSGVRMFDLGGPGAPGTTPLEIRGFQTRGSQLLLNGMSLNDPSSISGTFESFLPFLTIHDIEQVEVLKGGTGVLYGSDGQSGAVNLISRTPEAGTALELFFEGGSYDTFTENVLLNYGTERGGVVAGATRVDSNGLDTHGNYENTTIYASGSAWIIPEKLKISPLFRSIDADIDLDTSPSLGEDGNLIPNQDTEKNDMDGLHYILGVSAEHTFKDFLSSKAQVYYVDNDRDFLFDFDGYESKSEFEGTSLNVDLQTNADLPDINSSITLGFTFEHQEYDTTSDDLSTDEQRDQTAFFLYDRTHFLDQRLQLAGGVRVTVISDISKTVPSLEGSASYTVPHTESRIHASIAEGFRAPTLFESKGSMVDFNTGEVVRVGNDNLDVEESLSFDIGVEQPLLENKLVLDVTFFQIDGDDTIIFDFPAMTHFNGDGGKSQGIETSLLIYPLDWFYLRSAYTHLDKAERGDGTRRPRTPRNWFSITGVAEAFDITLSAQVRYRDTQEIEFFGEEGRYVEDDVSICDVSASYMLRGNIKLFVRADNIFDTNYTEAGYNMPGASVFGGVRVNFG